MARAATIPPQAQSPKRATRTGTRTRGATAKSTAAVAESAAAPRPRGRPVGSTKTKTTATADETKKKPGRKAAAPAEKKVDPETDVDMADDSDGTDDEIGFTATKKVAAPASSRGKSVTSRTTTTTSTTASRGSRNATITTTRTKALNTATDAESDDSDDDELAQVAQVDAPKRKVGRPRTKPAPETTTTTKTDTAAKPTRGRPRTVTKAVPATATETDTEKKPSTRTAATATAPTTSSLAKSSSLKDPPKKKKKVTFQDIVSDSDKENLPVAPGRGATAAGKKAAAATTTSQTGLKAKPVRKPAAATSTRGRKPAAETKSAAKKEPLSPKKATQVAKSGGTQEDAEDDEISGAKTDVKLVIRSPTKNNDSENMGLSSPVKRINFTGSTAPILPPKPTDSTQNDENSEATKPPVDFKESIIMASPARRLPPSPFKDAIKETPRRGPLFIKELSSKPIAQPDFTPMQTSPLKSSPKKGSIFSSSFSQSLSPSKAPSGPFTPGKASLLKSPAKRLFTPLKQISVTPMKSLVKEGEAKPSKDDEDVADAGENDTTNFGGDASADSPSPQKRKANDQELEVEKNEINDEDFEVEEKKEAVYEVEDDVFMDDPFVDKPGQFIENPEQSLFRVESPLQLPRADEHVSTEDVADVPAEDLDHAATEDFAIHVDPEDEENADIPVQETTPLPSADAEVTSVASRPVSPYEVADNDGTMSPLERVRSIPPPAPLPPAVATVHPSEGEYRDEDGPESDDETMIEDSPVKSKPAREILRPETPMPVEQDDETESTTVGQENSNVLGFTPLADQLSQWKASSPEKSQSKRPRRRGVFSLVGPRRSSGGSSVRDSMEPYQLRKTRRSMAARRSSRLGRSPVSADQQTDFEEKPARDEDVTTEAHEVKEEQEHHKVEEEQGIAFFEGEPEIEEPQPEVVEDMVQDEEAETASEGEDENVYGDENGPPAEESRPSTPMQDAEDGTDEDKENQDENTPLPVVTPVKNISYPREVHTVSKVPLKPEGQVSPLKMPRKRTRSLSSSSATRSSPRLRSLNMQRSCTAPSLSPRKSLNPSEEDDSVAVDRDSDEETVRDYTPRSRSTSPSKTPRRRSIAADDQVLRGAVVFVDVHTTEGEDASGIFVELLTQMGAKCVKSWSWNPRTSLSPVDGAEPNLKEEKIGITHVIYKDGGVRTLEKVRQAAGLVKCVGVGWVLEYVSHSAELYRF